MKKLLLTSLVALGLSVSANAADKSKTIIVGATPIPHAEILEVVKPILAKDGYTLEIKEFNEQKQRHSPCKNSWRAPRANGRLF